MYLFYQADCFDYEGGQEIEIYLFHGHIFIREGGKSPEDISDLYWCDWEEISEDEMYGLIDIWEE